MSAGVAIAGAVAMGYSNIFVTAPSPENLNTLFEFVFKGLDSLDYKVRPKSACCTKICSDALLTQDLEQQKMSPLELAI